MRRLAIIGGVSMALVAAVACATSEEPEPPSAEPEAEPSIPDASVRDVAIGSDAPVDARGPQCSSDGWCETILPDSNLVVRDIWPLPDRAFAIADSYNSGIKVLEWTSTDSTWRYIDDNSQNAATIAAERATRIWSPNANEVYYAVSPGTIFHGRRPVAPATEWTWTSRRLEDKSPPTLAKWNPVGVWGTDGDHVYAWHSNTLFRRESGNDGGAEWVPEYTANDLDDPDERLRIADIAGTNGNDLWLAGVRERATGACGIIVRKTSDGYRRIADGVVPPVSGACTPREGIPLVVPPATTSEIQSSPYVQNIPAYQLQSLDEHRLLALVPYNKFMMIAPDGAGYSASYAVAPAQGTVQDPRWTSFWSESADRQWLLGRSIGKDYGVVIEGSRIWEADGGPYQYSSIALNGAPNIRMPVRIRGTSNTNLWAVGDRYAIHKTTP